jgi:hypothetical protein
MARTYYENWITMRAFTLPTQKGRACQAAIIRCDRCATDMQVMLPMCINDLFALITPFGLIHNRCEYEEE